jgi:hypothetical protein
MFEFELYKDDPNWVAPLISDRLNLLMGKNNGLFANGPHAFFIVRQDGAIQARVLTGCDNEYIRRKGIRQGYFSLFDSYDNPEAVRALMDEVIAYQRSLGNDSITGPNSPTFDDFGMGTLVQGFDGPPVLYNPYNKPYYESLLLSCGFSQYMDHYAYDFDVNSFPYDYFERLSKFTMEKFDFRVVPCDLSDPRVPVDAHKVISEAVLATDNRFDMPVPTLEDIQTEMKNIKPFFDKDFAYLAYIGDKPIGFILAMPDYFQVLKRIRGRLLPLGLFKFLYYRRKIDGIRIIVQMVTPEYQMRAVPGILYAKLAEAVRRRNIKKVEGSTIEPTNLPSRMTTEKAGGRLYRIYRQYRLVFPQENERSAG